MRYQDFIAEIDALIPEGDRITASGATHTDPKFRQWRHRTESLVDEAIALGYRLPGTVRSKQRMYLAMWTGATEKDNASALTSDLSDTLIELRQLSTHFRKYGVAERAPASPDASPALLMPERVSAAWLWQNVPIGLWAAGIGLLVGAFLLGVAAGQTAEYHAVAAWVKSLFP